ncbi:ester cyclase [Sphingobacterium puteale]|uniref:Ester cyclase n=1 Tax=Sphingobacterium puteale TaxID=2420510 RepID=A0A420VS30_9SPHI|nr:MULTISPECIES: ester cyclase [Sphingobacterium]QIH34791.1 ester cyclase [Sphingobacterium sp. DR205]RKO69183.1 ester cyclase [Sphingobacterium puteale]
MNLTDNKKLVRNFYNLLEQENYSAVAELCHPEFVFYFQVDNPILGAEGFVASEKANFDAFKGFTMQIHEMIAENDKVAAYMIFEGSHTGKVLYGIEPTGKRIRFSLSMLLTIRDGKIYEKRAHFDVADIKAQLIR